MIGISKQFQTRSQKRAKRQKLNDETSMEQDWRNDPGEKACCIWEWWRVRVYEVPNPKLTYFALGLRLIVLTQVSSCAIERVFSQLKLIRDTCGDNMLEDMLEIRMFERNNGDIEQKICHRTSHSCITEIKIN